MIKIFIICVYLVFSYLFASSLEFYENSYAVIIGINNYTSEDVKDLGYAVEDAESIADLLITKLGYNEENIHLLLNEDATQLNIKKKLYQIAMEAGKNDRILVFYGGHGETISLPSGGEVGYLLPVDGKPDNLFATGLSMQEFKQISEMTSAKHVLYLVDVCYGGIMTIGTRSLAKNDFSDDEKYLKKITSESARQIITAGGKGDKSQERAIWGHSAFTKELLSGIEDGLADSDQDGYITSNELAIYLSKKVYITSEENQTPVNGRYGSGEGEFVFINPAYIEEEEQNVVESKTTIPDINNNNSRTDRALSDLQNSINLFVKSARSDGQNNVLNKFDVGDEYFDSLFVGPEIHAAIVENLEGSTDSATLDEIQQFSKKWLNPYFDYKNYRFSTIPFLSLIRFHHSRVSGLSVGPQFEVSQLSPMTIKLTYQPDYNFGLNRIFHSVNLQRYPWGNKKHKIEIRYYDGVDDNDDWFRNRLYNSVSSLVLGKDYQDHYLYKGAGIKYTYQPLEKLTLSTKYSNSYQSYLGTIKKYTRSIFKETNLEDRPNFGIAPYDFEDGRHTRLKVVLTYEEINSSVDHKFTHSITITDTGKINVPDLQLIPESSGWEKSSWEMKITPDDEFDQLNNNLSAMGKSKELVKRSLVDLIIPWPKGSFKIISSTGNIEVPCDAGYIDDCSGDGDCCPESWIGDGFADCEDQTYGCDLTCYDNDGGDCEGDSGIPDRGSKECSDCTYDFTAYGSECCDTAWEEYGLDCTTLENSYVWDCSGCNCPGDNSDSEGGNKSIDGCDSGYVDDCSGDGDCCPESWIGDGFADCEDQAYGCDLTCYESDGGDCLPENKNNNSRIESDSLDVKITTYNYEITVKLPPGTHAYRYLIDNTKYELDESADQAMTADGNAVSTVKIKSPFRFDIGYEFSDTLLGGDFSYEKLTFNYSYTYTLSRVDALSLRLIGGWSKKHLPVQELFYVGGEGSVRGFSYMDTKKFSGNQMLLAKLEYHFTYFPFIGTTFLFCDAAVIGNKFINNDPVISYGLGIPLGESLVSINDSEVFPLNAHIILYRTMESNDGNWGIEFIYNYFLNQLPSKSYDVLP